VTKMLAGKLSEYAPGPLYLLPCKALQRTNSTAAHFVNDSKPVGPIGENEASCTLRRRCCLYFESGYCFEDILSTPHLTYMFSIPANSGKVNLLSSTKNPFVKAPLQIKMCKNKLPDVSLPPEHILARWRTCIYAVLSCSGNF
jgi:hypothetical protein